MIWRYSQRARTLKLRRVFTLSASTSVMDLSKVAMTFIASCGSMRPEWTSSSRESMRASPMLE